VSLPTKPTNVKKRWKQSTHLLQRPNPHYSICKEMVDHGPHIAPQLRRTYTYWRNQARTQRRMGHTFPLLERQAGDAAKEYHDAVRRQKSARWEDFLADDTNIWQVAKYLDSHGSSAFDKIPLLFQTSLDEGELPTQWRNTKIIPLKKPSKGDYTVAKSWRPISLLSTLGKTLESIVAERISHAVETLGLLPTNHFGARRSARLNKHSCCYWGTSTTHDDQRRFSAWLAST
jgi:hypothetical protein